MLVDVWGSRGCSETRGASRTIGDAETCAPLHTTIDLMGKGMIWQELSPESCNCVDIIQIEYLQQDLSLGKNMNRMVERGGCWDRKSKRLM